MQIREHDTVVLSKALLELGLETGDIGAVVHVHGEGEAYEVEFVAGDGCTLGLVTLKPEEIRRLDARDILHARSISA
jgi:Domain of unknown function (DUF4926)